MKRFALTMCFALTACGSTAPAGDEFNVLDHLDPPYNVSCAECEPGVLQEVVDFWNGETGLNLFTIVEGEAFVRIRAVPYIPGPENAWTNLYETQCDVQVEPEFVNHVLLLAHEAGHCLGFDHSRNPESIMSAKVRPENRITEEIIEMIEERI